MSGRTRGDDVRLQYAGRVERTRDHATRMIWPASALTLKVTGTRNVRVVLSDTPRQDDLIELDDVMVSVDGQEPRMFALSRGRHVYPIATTLDPARTHTITVIKRTEAAVGAIDVFGVQIDPDGELLPVPAPRRRIEVLGDSITAGFGLHGVNAECPWRARDEDATRTYAYLGARALGAQYTALAYSGKGVTRNADPLDVVLAPTMYEQRFPDDSAPWDFSREPQPDVVIVNLGTNDFFAGQPNAQAFQRAYLALLTRIRQARPSALIVCALAPMLVDGGSVQGRTLARAWVQHAIHARSTAGDQNVMLIEQWTDPAEGVGCQFHPNARTHARLARELEAALRARLQW